MSDSEARIPLSTTETVSRRSLLKRIACSATAAGLLQPQSRFLFGARDPASPVIDTHMHVWANDPAKYPFLHPYIEDFPGAPHEATLEMLVEDMDRNGCAHAILVQCIYHGWDNSYVADCAERYPDRLKAHGLIDPTDPKVADKLAYWMEERGLSGMRFSPIYYQDGPHGGDDWLNADGTHELWRRAEKLGAVFNFFIAAPQLPKLETMVRAHPEVPVIIDHFSQIDLGVDDPERDFRKLLAMAEHPNVWVKVSELSSVSASGEYPFPDAYPYVRRVYEAFGSDRLLFGTGYPGAARAAYDRPTLAQEITLLRDLMPFFSDQDREKILGRNAAELWGFDLQA